MEIHDASPADGGQGALFGFVGVPASARRQMPEGALEAMALGQLARLFGPQAASPRHVWVKDWSMESETATDDDLAPLTEHPAYGLPEALRDAWGGRLVWASTEVGEVMGGYMEGALEAAERVSLKISRSRARL